MNGEEGPRGGPGERSRPGESAGPAGEDGVPGGPVGQEAAHAEETHQAAEALADVVRFAMRQMTALREIGFSAMATLHLLCRSGPCRITDLAVAEGISQPSMTAMVSRLEQNGLVARAPDPDDGRSVLVSITESGREVLRARRSGQVAFFSSLIDALEPDLRAQLTAAAQALHHMTDTDQVPDALAAAREAMDRSGPPPRPGD